jgi:nucleotide-binding universal stress UspA family protein
MFKKIAVAYNGSPEAARALEQAIHLAKALGAELGAITVVEGLPPFAAYATAADPSLTPILLEDRQEHCIRLHDLAIEAALKQGVELKNHLIEGETCESIIHFLAETKSDLLVIGLHRHTSHISRLWSTVYELARDAPCSVLGVH